MKTQKHFLYLMAVVCALTSCMDRDNMLTVIRPDGSCYKEFSSSVGSDFMLGKNLSEQKYFPMVVDSTWSITWKLEDSTQTSTVFPLSQRTMDSIMALMPLERNQKTNKMEKKSPVFDILLRRPFKSVEDMGKTFRLKPTHEWSKMKVIYHLEKKFRWFYTYYQYKETYPKVKTNFKTPVDSFMTNEEATYWFTGKPNIYKGMNGIEIREAIGSLEDKYNRWLAKNLWDNEFEVLLANYDQMKNPPVSLDSLAKSKDNIFNSKVRDNKDYDMEKLLNDFFKTKAFSIYWKTKDSPLKKHEKDFENQEFVSLFTKEFNYNLCMPGRSKPIENVIMNGDTLNFKLTAYRMVYDNYVIEAESRRANVWAFVVSGLILVLTVGSFWYKPKGKSRGF
ncbi:MAG TPA: hypothetical protein VFP20_00530 [Bacteroidales bacterium]|nr:hypothetical protein [Bacteroidales bacterium]